MRKRQPGYITQEKSNAFGLDVTVQRQPYPKSDFSPSGDPVPDGQPAINENLKSDVTYREVIPMGEIGSEEGGDLDILTPPQFVDTAQYNPQETRDPRLHGAVHSIRSLPKDPVAFQPYASFEPRRAWMPRAAQDQTFLQDYGLTAADPRMLPGVTSNDLFTNKAASNRIDLYGKNEDGMAIATQNESGERVVPPGPRKK